MISNGIFVKAIILISLVFNINHMTQKTNKWTLQKSNDNTINQFENATYDAFNNT